MEIKSSKSSTNLKCNKCSKKLGIIDTSYSTSESAFRNKIIHKNYSLKTFQKNNLKLSNNLNNNSSKASSERRVVTTLSSSEMNRIKQDILLKFEENKNKNMLLDNIINKSNHSNKISNNSNQTKIIKRNKRNRVDNLLNKIEKKFEKYNKENMAYKVYHDYQKLNFNDEEYEDYNFLERMELYSIKRNLKDKTINEYIRIKSPKLPNDRLNQVFDDLINDVKIRKQNKEKREKEELNFINYENRNNNLKNKKVNQKEINEIVKRLNKPKRNFIVYNKIKDMHRDMIIKNGGKTKNNNVTGINKKNDIKNNIPKSNSMKSIKKSEQINSINNRLYYKEINKRDSAYKLFVENVNNLLKLKENIKPKIKDNIDYISYDQLRKMRNNNKMINIKSMNNNIKKKDEYIFKDDDDSLNSLNNNRNDKNNNNYKGIKTHNNYNNKNYNELFTFSRPQTNNSINNLKISIMIDNFFSNK